MSELEQKIEKDLSRLHWLADSLKENSYVFNFAAASFGGRLNTSVSECEERIAHRLYDEIRRGLCEGCDEDSLIHMLNEPKWGKKILSGAEKALVTRAYRYCFKSRFPRLYAMYIEQALQSSLLEGETGEDLTNVILGIYGHSYFFNRQPTVVRIAEPWEIGGRTRWGRKKGKTPEVPQKNMALFLYNAEEVRSGNTTKAVVSLDGETLETVVASHNRVKLIKKKALVDRALTEGIYSAKDIVLPVIGLRPFWQNEFCGFLQENDRLFTTALNSILEEGSLTGGSARNTFHQISLSAQRFIGDRLTALEYWEELNTIPAFRLLFQGKVFNDAVATLDKSPSRECAFKMMTIT